MLRDYIRAETDRLAARSLIRSPRVVSRARGAILTIDGRDVVSFCTNDYLGLAQHPDLARAARDAEPDFGWGTSASRLLSGTTAWHVRLEERLARHKNREASLYFVAGFMANLGLLSALGGPDVDLFSDELNHASVVDGCRLSGSKTHVFRHRDVAHAAELLRASTAPHKLILTDAVFSMDGDLAPLRELSALAREHDADLFVDDAHGFGILGARGRGTAEALAVTPTLQTVTLSKAAGSAGGFLVGDRAAIDLIRSRARSFIFTTAYPPAVCAAGLAAIDLLEAADDRRAKLWENVAHLAHGLRAQGFDLRDSQAPIIPIVLGANDRAVKAAQILWDAGLYAPAIRPPTVPEGQARLRISVTAAHEKSHLDQLLDALRKL